MSKSVRITVKFPELLRKEMLQAIINEGYGLRGKSRWVTEALQSFLSIETFVDFVDIGGELGDTKLAASESFYLDQGLADRLDRALVTVRKTYPKIEGVKSIIIRSSVLQRLLRPHV